MPHEPYTRKEFLEDVIEYDKYRNNPNVHIIKNYDEMHEDVYGHPVHYLQCMCSTAHTFGNITAFVQNWLLNLFPEKTFNTIHVNSKIAHLQMRSTPKEYLKKTPPMFILRPRIDWTDNTKFLNNTPLIERQNDIYSTYGGGALQDFFQDDKKKIAIKYQMNRHVINFDVVLVFNTLMQQINWSNYFLNAVRQEIPFNLETCLESYLSPELLKVLSDLSGIPMFDDDKCTTDFLRYLNANSVNPVTYKLQGSTRTQEYYRYYPVKIDTIITNFATDEGEKVGHIMDRYTISFSMRCEFYGTGFYYLFSDKIPTSTIVEVHDEDSYIIPVFTDVLMKEDIDLPIGWHLFASPSCRLADPNEIVPIDSVLNTSIKECIKFHVQRGITLAEFLKIRIRKQGKIIEQGKDWDFDPETLTIRFHDCGMYYTYKILIMINVEYINNLVKQIYNLK